MTSAAGDRAAEPYELPAEHAAIRADARELATRFAERHREVRLSAAEHGCLHPALWDAICARGWPGLLVGEAHGGSGGGLLAYAIVLQELAAANLVLWAPVLDSAIAHAIAEVGPEPARAWLERIASGAAHLGLAVTEPDCGHNVFRSQTTVERRGDCYVLHGVKAVTSATDIADRVLVFARSPGTGEGGRPRFTTVLVDPRGDGVHRTELRMGAREGVRQFRLELDGARAPLDALVGAEGAGLLALWPSTHVERVLMAALAIGNARYCVDRALGRAAARNVFGERPIAAEQAIQHPLAMVHARLQAVELLVHRTAARFDAGTDPLQLAGEANMVKILAAELLFDAADHAIQTLGMAAWDHDEGMIDLFLDARLSRSAPISQELALNFVAQHVLGLASHR